MTHGGTGRVSVWIGIAAIMSSLSGSPGLLAEGSNTKLSDDASDFDHKALAEYRQTLEEIQKSEENTAQELRTVTRRLQRLARKRRQDAAPHYYLGIAYQLDQKFDRAEKSLAMALRRNPEFHEAWVERGDTAAWLKEFDKAIRYYDRAIELEPKYRLAHRRRGEVLLRLGRFKESKQAIQTARKLEEDEELARLEKMIDVQIEGPGWESKYEHETENYKVFTSVSKSYAETVAERAERILTIYRKIFPDIKRPDRKYEIWVHSGRKEYVQAGNPPMAGGHYEPLVRKLVLFRYDKLRDLEIVMYHEAFHQFLHDYLTTAPQWFNEGLADYYGGFVYVEEGGKRYMKPAPNPWRLNYVQQAIRYQRCADPGELMQMTRAEMYNPRSASIHYAQAWAMIYFMVEGGQRYGYDKLLINYFKALLRGYDTDKAYKATFGRLNMDYFDKHWKSYIMKLQATRR